MMKKLFSIVLTILMILSFLSSAFAAGYTLPEKMQRQLLVGSGLKGSFVVHGNISEEIFPFLYSIKNTEFEIRGISHEGDLHYYIYQPGENESRNALTELYKNNNSFYFRSDLLDNAVYLLPDAEHIINLYLKSEGPNPSVFLDLMKILVFNSPTNANDTDTSMLEKQIENWITGFSPETTIQSGENGTPRLSQSFSIPVESMYNAATELVLLVSRNDPAMSYLRSILSDEQISLYFNPDLAYYYLEAMQNLDLTGEIVFMRTVSAMGEPLFTSLTLPLDASRTGFSSLTIQNDETRKSILITGPKRTFQLDMPTAFDKAENDYDHEFRLLRIDTDDSSKRNLAIQIHLTRKHEEYDDSDESKAHESDHYTIQITRDTSWLPPEVDASLIPEMEPVEAEIDLRYSSKLQLSSPTTLEIGLSIVHGEYNFDLTGIVKTATPWEFSPFDISEATDTASFAKDNFQEIKKTWIRNASTILIHTPEEISLTNVSDGDSGQNP